MKVLMFGWEFPPYKSGGLGTACFDLTKGLSRQGVHVTFVMPFLPDDAKGDFVHLVGTNNIPVNVKIKKIDSILAPYLTSSQYEENLRTSIKLTSSGELYGKDIYMEVERFAEAAAILAATEEHEVIHVHDWMTYKAGIRAREVSGKPLVVHIHATEFDRTGGNPNSFISQIEYEGLKQADIIIANSNFTKENVVAHYQISPDKIKVVHWGIDPENPAYNLKFLSPFAKEDKIVLFMGRVTIQKGPDYFIEVANKVLQYEKNVKFVFAGTGDMLPRIIDRAVELGISDKVLFTGWLSGDDVHKAFQMADLYVMPSVAEPFGLVALEALKNGTPLLISKTSGVSEVVNHALKADFWDINDMTDKIVNVIRHKDLLDELKDNGTREAERFNLDEPAKKCMQVYREAIG